MLSRNKGRVIVLSGPSGAGKTTLHDLLLKSPCFRERLVRSISATTRPPRGTEQQGRDYLFLSQRMFESRLRRGHFLEWARVFENYYGTPTKNVRDILRSGRHVLLCIDVQGAKQVKAKMPEAVLFFVRTPTMKALRRRLEARGTDSPKSVALRLRTAGEELEQACHYDHVIINDDLTRAFQSLEKILTEELDPGSPARKQAVFACQAGRPTGVRRKRDGHVKSR